MNISRYVTSVYPLNGEYDGNNRFSMIPNSYFSYLFTIISKFLPGYNIIYVRVSKRIS